MQPKQSLTVGELDEINKLRRLPIPHFGLCGGSFMVFDDTGYGSRSFFENLPEIVKHHKGNENKSIESTHRTE